MNVTLSDIVGLSENVGILPKCYKGAETGDYSILMVSFYTITVFFTVA